MAVVDISWGVIEATKTNGFIDISWGQIGATAPTATAKVDISWGVIRTSPTQAAVVDISWGAIGATPPPSTPMALCAIRGNAFVDLNFLRATSGSWQ